MIVKVVSDEAPLLPRTLWIDSVAEIVYIGIFGRVGNELHLWNPNTQSFVNSVCLREHVRWSLNDSDVSTVHAVTLENGESGHLVTDAAAGYLMNNDGATVDTLQCCAPPGSVGQIVEQLEERKAIYS